MNNKLRRRFILTSTLISFIVLSLIMIFINMMNYRTFLSDRDDYLNDFLAQRSHVNFEQINPHIKKYNDIYVIDYQKGLKKLAIGHRNQALKNILAKIEASSKTKGIFKNHRFYNDKHKKILYLVNTQRQNKYFFATLANSIGILFMATLIVFILSYLLSPYAIKPIVENQQKQRQFITDASHELRTPLTIITTNVELMEYDLQDNRYLNNIKSATSRLSYLIGDLLTLAKLDENQKDVYQQFDFSDVVSEIIEKYQALLSAKNCTINYTIDHPIICHANREEYIKIINILMENINKYASENTEVILNLTKKSKHLIIETINCAENLEKRDYNQIFERFTRLDNHRNTASGGNGIGLSILKSIVEKYHGKTNASSDGVTLHIVVEMPL